MSGSRRKGRIMALQALFEVDSVGHDIRDILLRSQESGAVPETTWQFGNDLVTGVIGNVKKIDSIIESYAHHWPVGQIAPIDRNILRIAVYELNWSNIPAKAITNEAVEIAKSFGGDSSQRFVNGVLGSLLNEKSA